jgi:VWFA-related protein
MQYRLITTAFTVLAFATYVMSQDTATKTAEPANGPVNIGLVIDCSGSQRLQMDRIVSIIKQVSEAVSEDDQAFVLRFVDAGKISVVQEFTNSKSDLTDAAEGLYVEGGATALIDGVDVGRQYIVKNKPAAGSGVRALIVVSDGDDRGSAAKPDDVIASLKKNDVQVYTIAISDLKITTKLLDRFSKETGGKSFAPRTTAELSNAVIEILRLVHGGAPANR